MFNALPKTPQDFFTQAGNYFAALPKTPSEVKEALGKVKNVVDTEVKNAQSIYNTYQKSVTGDATINDIMEANKKAQSLMIATRFAMLMAIPGAFVALPAMAEAEKEFDVEIIPQSVKEEFNI